MKNMLLFIAAVAAISLSAQAPQFINYQAVARNTAGNVLPNQQVTVRLTIHANTPTGAIAYVETDTVTTNQFGLFTIAIGKGTTIPGGFAGISWGSGDKFLQVELDPAAGFNFADMGTTQLLSVPYALYAETSGDNGWLKDVNNIYNANTGNVGIGTSSPGQGANSKFDVVGKVSFRTINGNTDELLIFDDYNGAHRIYTDNPNGTGLDLILGTYPNGHTNQLVLKQSTGNVGIGTSTPAASAALEINSTTGALLLPRMNTIQRDALTAMEGMIIYNVDNSKFQGYSAIGNSTTLVAPGITDTSAVNNFGSCQWLSQTFVAENEGAVNKVRVFAYASGGPNPIRYRLRTGNTPGSGAFLDSVEVTVPNVKGWIDLVFPSHPYLSLGQSYQLEVNTNQSATHCTWIYTTDTPYTNGDLFLYDTFPLPGWNTFGTHDLVFEVYQDVSIGGPGWVNLH